jgi:lysophospholipase L1-like esterase
MLKVLILKTLLSFLLLVCAIPPMIAQTKNTTKKKKIVKQTPIIFENLNVISFRANLQPFLQELKKIKKSQSKKLSILHIGDSHIQAGFFTEKVRQLLQNKYGNGGRGLIFPYQIANSTQPETYLATKTGEWTTYNSTRTNQFSQWGLTGFTALTKDVKATITLRPNHKHPEKITRTKIFYPLFDKTSFDLKLLVKRQDIRSSKIDMNGYVEYKFKTPQPLVSLHFSRQHAEQSQFLLQGMTFENDDKGIAYHVAGVNGAKLESFLRCADFQKHVAALKPDLVIISLGTNEALVPNFKADLFKANCRLLLWQIRKAMPQACILFTSPNVSCNFDKQPNPHLDTLTEALQEIAKTEKVAFWNFYAISGKKENVETWKSNFLLKNDGIHLTRQGYELQGELLFKAMMGK